MAKLGLLFGRVGDTVNIQVGQVKILVLAAGRRGVNLAELVTDEFPFGRLNPIPRRADQLLLDLTGDTRRVL